MGLRGLITSSGLELLMQISQNIVLQIIQSSNEKQDSLATFLNCLELLIISD